MLVLSPPPPPVRQKKKIEILGTASLFRTFKFHKFRTFRQINMTFQLRSLPIETITECLLSAFDMQSCFFSSYPATPGPKTGNH